MTSLPVFLRATVKFLEVDKTERIDTLLSTMGAIVGEFERGSEEATYQSGIDKDFRRRYGQIANPRISFAHDTATTFMTQSGNLLIKRVTKNALHSGASIIINNGRLLVVPFSLGTDNYEKEGIGASAVIRFVGNFSASNTFKIDITDGVQLVTSQEAAYTNSHNESLETVAANIQTALNTFAVGSTARVYKEPTGGNNSLIIIRISKNVSLDLSNVVIAGGSLTAELDENPKAYDVFAENPGIWSKNYGLKISNIDPGVRERFNLTLAGPFVTGNSFSVTIGDEVITEPFATNSDTTLANLAETLALHDEIDDAIVQAVPGAVNNDRTILIIAKRPGIDKLTFLNPAITGGATRAAVGITKVMTGIEADGSFTLGVYSRANLNVPDEQFEVSLGVQQDSRGNQQNIVNKVNRSSGKSINIRIAQPGTLSKSMYNSDGAPVTVPSTVIFMDGGTDGTAATSADIRAGWSSIDDRVQFPYSIMLNAGYTSVSVQKHMALVAENRSDCIAVLDAPADRQGAQDLRSYRLNELDIDSSYCAMYAPDVEIEDDQTAERRFIPPSGPVGATYAYSDRLSSFVGAPAGLNRGQVRIAVGLRHRYTVAEQELLNPSPININTIIDKPGIGPTVMAEQTLQVKNTIRSSVHARRILNYIKTGLVDGLDYSNFEPNTTGTRFNAKQKGVSLLDPLTDEGGNKGLYEYRIKCDDDNNNPEVIDADQLAYDVYLKITRVIKGIYVRGILMRTGARFEEVEEA